MSGRRHLGTAGAAFLHPLSQVVGLGITEDVKARDERRQLINRIANEVARGEATGRFPSGSTNTFVRTGQLSPATSVGGLIPSASLEDLLQSGATITHTLKTPQGTIRITRGGQRPGSPATDATRIAGLQSRIQQMDQRNALAPGVAMANRLTAYPNPTFGFGGYTDNPPGMVGSLFGQQQRPPAPAIPMADTTFLKQRLAELTGATSPPAGGETDAAQAHAIQILQQRGYPVTPENIAAVMKKLHDGGAQP